jgi:hypothetical protein
MIKEERRWQEGGWWRILCLTLIIKEFKISYEQDRVATTLNIIKIKISYLV